MLRRWRRWRDRRQRARAVAVMQISEMYYREGFVPRGTFRRLRREALRAGTSPDDMWPGWRPD